MKIRKFVNPLIRKFANPKSDFSLDKLLLIGSTLAATKVVFIVIPYFFSSALYNEFNKIYYTASLLILFGSIGFNISVSRISFKAYKISLAVAANVIVTFVLLTLLTSVPFDLLTAVPIFIYVLFGCIGGIYSFKLLFSGDYKGYSVAMFLYAVFHLLVIPVVLFANVSIITAFPFITLLWFLSCYKLFFKDKSDENDAGIKVLYSVGLSAFIINNLVPLALVFDKYYVNHFFGTAVANSYTFAWGLTAPLFYIGVLIEKMIYSSKGTKPFVVIKKSFLLLMSLIFAYCLLFTAGLRYFPFIVPHSVDAALLVKIFTYMIAGYSLYVLFHFPVNGYLFKFSTVSNQKKIAAAFLVFTVVFGLAAYIVCTFLISIDYLVLLLIIWLYIFSLLFIKIRILAGNLNLVKLVTVPE